jgi:formate C-acetyltransferase
LLSGLINQAINNGENPKRDENGKTSGQTGLATGYLYDMKSFDDVLDAVKKQMDYFVDWHIAFTNIHEYVVAENAPLPVISAVMDGCMESGKDVSWGGAKYNSTGFAGVGIGTLVDSLAVIKYMVFDKKLIGAKEFLEAVNNNWEGQEELRQNIHKIVPRYGNDDPYTDDIAKWVADNFAAKVNSATGPRGNHFSAGLYPVAMHVLYGMMSPATPDGRKAGEPLSDGISPVQQMDKSGPLATLKSTSVFDHSEFPNGTLLNMKLHPKSVEGEGLYKLKSLIMSYFDLKGMELQFNIVSAETLRDAQANPEAHKDLVVRIAGFSAYFTELFKGMQDDVIHRTEVEL